MLAGKKLEAAAGRPPGQYHGGSAGLPGRRLWADDNQKGVLPMGFDARFNFEGPVEITSGMVTGGAYQVRLTDEAGNRVSLVGLTVEQLDEFQEEVGKLAQKIKKKQAQEQAQKKREEERSVDYEEGSGER
jgi:TolA-binding protein